MTNEHSLNNHIGIRQILCTKGDRIEVPEKCHFHDITGDRADAHTATTVHHMAIQVQFGPDPTRYNCH
jgi:hypothetical protein